MNIDNSYFQQVDWPFNKSGLIWSSLNDVNEYNGEFGSPRSTTSALGSRNVVFIFFAINDLSVIETGVSVSSCSWLFALDCSEVGVGGSDNFFVNVIVLLTVDFDGSFVVNTCCELLFDGNVCGLLFDVCCLCVDGVTINVSNGCRTDGGLPVGWLDEKFGGFAVGKLPKENRGAFADDGLGKWTVEGCVEGGWTNEKFGGFAVDTFPDENWGSFVDVELEKGTVEGCVEGGWTNEKFGRFSVGTFPDESWGSFVDVGLEKGTVEGCVKGGWTNEKFGGVAVGKFPNENRGTFVDVGLEKGIVEDCVEGGWLNWNCGVDPDADPCENEKPNGDPLLAYKPKTIKFHFTTN